MNRTIRQLVGAAALALTGVTAHAANPSYADGTLTIPSVEVSGSYYSASLAVVSADPLTLELASAAAADAPTSSGGPTFAGTTLTLPTVEVGSERYSVTMALVGGSDPLRFTLSSATPATTGLTLTSSGYSDGAAIPVTYACSRDGGSNHSVPLSWSGAPSTTQSLALVMDDPDANQVVGYTWVHWNVFNLPAATTELAENATLPSGAAAGPNHNGNSAYNGPCPPVGQSHTYRIRLFALDTTLTVPSSPLTIEEFQSAYAAYIVGESATLSGVYTP